MGTEIIKAGVLDVECEGTEEEVTENSEEKQDFEEGMVSTPSDLELILNEEGEEEYYCDEEGNELYGRHDKVNGFLQIPDRIEALVAEDNGKVALYNKKGNEIEMYGGAHDQIHNFIEVVDGEHALLVEDDDSQILFSKENEELYGGPHEKIERMVEMPGTLDDCLLVRDGNYEEGFYEKLLLKNGHSYTYFGDSQYKHIYGFVGNYLYCKDGVDSYNLIDKQGNVVCHSKEKLGEYKGKRLVKGKECLEFEDGLYLPLSRISNDEMRELENIRIGS